MAPINLVKIADITNYKWEIIGGILVSQRLQKHKIDGVRRNNKKYWSIPHIMVRQICNHMVELT